MEYGAIELSGGAGAIAERNEEVNRRRMEQGRAGAGGPLKVTDPQALQRLMAEMKAKAEQQRAAEEAREAERKAREGDAYRTPEQRAEAARAARAAAAGAEGGEEARVLEGRRFDPARDYYALLGIPRGASAADVRKAYKKLALFYHPDKHKAESEEQQAAVADKFKQVVEAFDVLSDEEQRAIYDKCRDYMEANPGKGLPALSPEEAALMRSGAAELSRLRRQGAKAVKHAPLEKELFVSLAKLNAGCTKSVPVERRRVRPDGQAFLSTKNIHAVIRRGSREGDRLVFEGDGEEGVDSLPGDLVLVLRQKPHPQYRRVGGKDLEMFAGAAQRGEVLCATEVTTIRGRRRLLVGSPFREAAANGGAGGMWTALLAGEGLYDAAEPWEQPPGDLRVQLRYPAWLLAEAAVSCCLAPQPVHLLGGSGDAVAAAMAAGSIAAALNHRREAEEMAAEAAGAGAGASAGAAAQALPGPSAVCLVAAPEGSGPRQAAASPAAAALLRGLACRVPGLATATVASCCLLDDEWLALSQADVLVLDLPLPEAAQGSAAAAAPAEQQQQRYIEAVQRQLAAAGLLELVWQRLWAGALLVGVGQGCALLGQGCPAPAPAVLPWYCLRAGGDGDGWAALHAALAAAPGGAAAGAPRFGAGVLAGGCWVADPATGHADLLVAPPREALVAAAAWAAQPGHQPEERGLEEAEEEHGFFCELAAMPAAA